jgi:hypothetical protein
MIQGIVAVRTVVIQFRASTTRRSFVSSLEKAMGRKAANQFIESIDFNSQRIVSVFVFSCLYDSFKFFRIPL